MKTVLVTGGAGAIGSRLVAILCREYRVLVLDDMSSGWFENIRGLPIHFWRGSVNDDEILKEVFRERPRVILHLAANFANQNSVDYPHKDLMVNGLGTLKVLQYAVDSGNLDRFVYTSSSCVYGNRGASSEADREYSLDTPYAVTKLLGEQYVAFFHRHHGLPTVSLRLFNSYGPGEYPGKYRNVIPNFFHRALNGMPLVITGTGEETRDFTYVEDTIQALLLAMTHSGAIGETFNVGSGVETPIGELADQIVEITGSRSPIERLQRRAWDSVERRRADIQRIKSKLGFCPQVDLSTGLQRTCQWFKEQKVSEFRPV